MQTTRFLATIAVASGWPARSTSSRVAAKLSSPRSVGSSARPYAGLTDSRLCCRNSIARRVCSD